MPTRRTEKYLTTLRAQLDGALVTHPVPEEIRGARDQIAAALRTAFPEIDPRTIGQIVMVAIGAMKTLTTADYAPEAAIGCVGYAAYDLDRGAA